MANHPRQLDLLTDWTPPAPTVAFDDATVRAATLDGRISRAVGVTLKECAGSREVIAKAMTAFLGRPVSKNMLDAWASQSREDHTIGLPQFIALMHATGDRRLLELIAEPMGWAVVARKHLPLIELAAVQDKLADLQAIATRLRGKAKVGGGLP